MISLQQLAGEFAITASDGGVWLAIGEGLLLGGFSLVVGVLVARGVGLLQSDAPAGEVLGVGLAAGLMVLAAWWAAIRSGGRSSFTVVAVGFALAVSLAIAHRVRRLADAGATASDAPSVNGDAAAVRKPWVVIALAGGVFMIAVALLYGSTMAPSPRDGVQPFEKTDIAFYAVLGRDLATTGTESNIPPSGFAELPGVADQTWYHWGELWLASAVITIFGTAPMLARYIVVLPVVLLAAAALTGTVVRRMNDTTSRPAFLFGFLACLVLAPLPLIAGPFFSIWPGMLVGITVFGLAASAVLFGVYNVVVLGTLKPGYPLHWFVGSAFAFILPAHIVIAFLALVGVGSIWTIRIARSLLAERRLPEVGRMWRRTALVALVVLHLTAGWGIFTGHGLGGGGSMAISPFNASWRDSITTLTIEAGVLLAIPLAWILTRRERPVIADIFLGTMALLVIGALFWGWRIAVFNMFYFFFGGIAVFAVPVAAAAVWLIISRLRSARRTMWAVGILAVCAIQLELGGVFALGRLESGVPDYEPVPVSLLQAIRELPADAKLAYACEPFEEISFVNSKLLGLDAHTGHRIVPMCFEADVHSPLFGTEPLIQIPDADFASAPQRALYPDVAANPSSTAVRVFLKDHGIDYIYADARHPNSLVDNAVPIASSGSAEVLQIP